MNLLLLIEAVFDSPRFKETPPPWSHGRHTGLSKLYKTEKPKEKIYYRKIYDLKKELIDRVARAFVEISAYRIFKKAGVPVPESFGFTIDPEKTKPGVFTSVHSDDSEIPDEIRKNFLASHALIFYLLGHADRNFNNFVFGKNKGIYAIDFEQAFTFDEYPEFKNRAELIEKLLKENQIEPNFRNISLINKSIKRYEKTILDNSLLEKIFKILDSSMKQAISYYKKNLKLWGQAPWGASEDFDYEKVLSVYLDKIKGNIKKRFDTIKTLL